MSVEGAVLCCRWQNPNSTKVKADSLPQECRPLAFRHSRFTVPYKSYSFGLALANYVGNLAAHVLQGIKNDNAEPELATPVMLR
jgi:hypothetical protein